MCVVVSAVDRLAEARRAVGQANDDGKHAAQLELIGRPLFSGSMLATVICPRSGKTHTIRPGRWALAEALTWFEQGECWLTEHLVDPPLGMLYGKERVTIFVGEHDLQRLMAKQEVKQEAAPPPAATSGRGKQTAAVFAAFKTLFPSGSISGWNVFSDEKRQNSERAYQNGRGSASGDQNDRKSPQRGRLAVTCRDPPRSAAYCREIP